MTDASERFLRHVQAIGKPRFRAPRACDARERGKSAGKIYWGRRVKTLSGAWCAGRFFQRLENFFSNGWKIPGDFSNDWKNIFQWLENLGRFFQ
ncbi:MAG: hypothetical protein IKQ55_05055 [Kiritimatiellae bacterium]|nr:hypothetical protein [Kiritimatiellia bacterium]